MLIIYSASLCAVRTQRQNFTTLTPVTVSTGGRGRKFCQKFKGAAKCFTYIIHSWAQRKLSPLSSLRPLNIMLLINGPLISLGFKGLND